MNSNKVLLVLISVGVVIITICLPSVFTYGRGRTRSGTQRRNGREPQQRQRHRTQRPPDHMMVVSSDMIAQVLKEMPLQEMDYYSERFYPEMIKTLNKRFYSRKHRAKTIYTEKRIRNIKLNAFLVLPPPEATATNTNITKSRFPILSKTSSDSTTFILYNVKDTTKSGLGPGKQIIDIRSPDLACLFGMSEQRTAVKAKACREDVPNMSWDLIPNLYGDFWIRQKGTKLCLAPAVYTGPPIYLQLSPCSRYDPLLIWEVQDAHIYYKKK